MQDTSLNPKTLNQDDELITMVRLGNIRDAQSLLDRKASINGAMTPSGARALHVATHK